MPERTLCRGTASARRQCSMLAAARHGRHDISSGCRNVMQASEPWTLCLWHYNLQVQKRLTIGGDLDTRRMDYNPTPALLMDLVY